MPGLLLSVYRCVGVVSLPVDQLGGQEKTQDEHKDEKEEEEEEEEEEAVDQSHLDSSRSYKTLLLVYRIMYYPTFDTYFFPPQSVSTAVNTTSQPTLDDQVSRALEARYSGCLHLWPLAIVILVLPAGCLTLLEILEIYWNNFSLLEILEIYWKLAKSPGNFLADSKFLYFTVYQ